MIHEQIAATPKTSVVELEILNLVTDPNMRGAIAELQSYLKDYALLVTDLRERMVKVEEQMEIARLRQERDCAAREGP